MMISGVRAAPSTLGGRCACTGLTEAEEQQVAQLKSRDQEVRMHEQAHASVGGQHAGTPSYSYETGPDGKQYAVGGEVPIDAAPVAGDPKATIEKMTVVERAARAPAEPSAQDQKVAAEAQARRAQAQAQAELIAMRAEEKADDQEGDASTAAEGYADAAAATADVAAFEMDLAA